MHAITATALRHLGHAHALLHSFDAAQAMESPLFMLAEDPRLLELTEAGRKAAEDALEVLAPLALEAHELSGDLLSDHVEEFQLADAVQLTLQLIVAGVSGALAGPLPAGEAMNSVYRLAERPYDALRIRAESLSPREAA